MNHPTCRHPTCRASFLAHASQHAPCCAAASHLPSRLRPRSHKKFLKYLAKELKAKGEPYDLKIAGAKWNAQEEGHEFKFEFGEA